MIKPDLLAGGKKNEILDQVDIEINEKTIPLAYSFTRIQLRNKRFTIHTSVDKLLSDEEMIKIFKPVYFCRHARSLSSLNYFFQDIDIIHEFNRFMSSGPSTYAIVSKGHTGRSTFNDLRSTIGPRDPDLAKANQPDSFTAVYGTDSIMNGFHSSANMEEALKLTL